jgi:2-amino-4-hydroxy-6-hydroxymethyldihydropteridine diphosphokinase
MSRDLARPFPGPKDPPAHGTVQAVIAFGANLGDREATITDAAERIARLPLVEELQLSEMFETVAIRPEGPDPDAAAYLNAVAIITTQLAPSILLGFLHAIEEQHGRERRIHWGDRTLDLDLIVYGDIVSQDPGLLLPHPRAKDRLFVLEPWLSLDPNATIPGAGTVADLVAELLATEA